MFSYFRVMWNNPSSIFVCFLGWTISLPEKRIGLWETEVRLHVERTVFWFSLSNKIHRLTIKISLSIVISMWIILSLDLFHKGTNRSDTNLTVCGQLPFTHYTSVTGQIYERETAACSHFQLLNSGKQKQRLLFVKAGGDAPFFSVRN